MTAPSDAETLLNPRAPTPRTSARSGTWALSPDILRKAATRVRTLALLYAFTFFMSAFFPNLLSAERRAYMWQHPWYWMPDLAAISAALGVAYVVVHRRVSISTALNIGLVFFVASNYGIALAEFVDVRRLDSSGWLGLSWVAVWTPLYVVAVPTPPLRAVLAMLASVSSVPVVIGTMILTGRTTFQPPLDFFFFGVAFPYLLVVVLGYVGAHVVYTLGREVTRAQELGSYRLVERIGSGGMGEVWRATHRLLARPAAIKLIRAVSDDEGRAADLIRRFEREAQVTARLRSPHTVELWDFGVSDDGAFYYVMELLDGLDLHTLVASHGPVPAERAIYLVRQICHSLAEAEDHGLVHRDIKPANVVVGRYGGDDDFVKVLDFGIVKATGSAITDSNIMATRETAIAGTPAFIAPEQALGAADVDGRADIYATGCVLYWLLTGQLVFEAETPMGVLLHHAHTEPAPPSSRTELPIPAELDSLVLACLAKDRSARPQTARELAAKLAAVRVTPHWTEARAKEWWARHRPS